MTGAVSKEVRESLARPVEGLACRLSAPARRWAGGAFPLTLEITNVSSAPVAIRSGIHHEGVVALAPGGRLLEHRMTGEPEGLGEEALVIAPGKGRRVTRDIGDLLAAARGDAPVELRLVWLGRLGLSDRDAQATLHVSRPFTLTVAPPGGD